MSGFSSFKESKLLFENWRKFLVKEARNQDKARLEELKKQELESASVAPDQTA